MTDATGPGLHIGVIGLGLGKLFAHDCLANGLTKRVVICDSDAERRSAFRADHSDTAAEYVDIDAMLEKENLDAVCVVTPDHVHRSNTVRILQAGINVLVTKPLACTLEDGRAMIAAAAASGKQLMVAHEKRYHADSLFCKELIESGKLGDILYIQADSLWDKREHFRISPWYASSEAGRTAIVGSGIHQVDYIRFLADSPLKSVSAFGNERGTPAVFKGNKTLVAAFQFESGTMGQITTTYAAHWFKGMTPMTEGFKVMGTEGWIIGNRAWWEGQEQEILLPAEGNTMQDGIRTCVNTFLEALAADTPVPISGEEGFRSLAMAAAADTSAAEMKMVVPARI